MRLLIGFTAICFLVACSQVEPEKKIETIPAEPKVEVQTNNPIIGGIERVYVDGMKAPFHARIDTGAQTSSIDVQNLVPFERDGDRWVAFDVINRNNGEKIRLEKPLKRRIAVRRTEQGEHRYVVGLKIKMGNETIKADFSLNDRSKFDYQVLIGRNVINGRFIVDTSIENTLR